MEVCCFCKGKSIAIRMHTACWKWTTGGLFSTCVRFHVCSCSPCQGSAQSAKPRVGFSVRDPDVNLIDDFQLTSCHQVQVKVSIMNTELVHELRTELLFFSGGTWNAKYFRSSKYF